MSNDHVRAWVEESRARQGLPPTAEDANFLAILAADVLETISSNQGRIARPRRTRDGRGQSTLLSHYELAA